MTFSIYPASKSGKMSFTLTNCDLNELLSHIYRTHQLLMPQGVALKNTTAGPPGHYPSGLTSINPSDYQPHKQRRKIHDARIHLD